MPSIEQRGHESEPIREQTLYWQAARFNGEKSAGLAYAKAQQLIYETDCDLSAFRFQLSRLWHVAILGELPPYRLKERLETILSTGEHVVLPAGILQLLHQRRVNAIRKGHWLEGHYDPGKPLL